jgi:alpha-beta hydrolase superfamily lysophospholipase
VRGSARGAWAPSAAVAAVAGLLVSLALVGCSSGVEEPASTHVAEPSVVELEVGGQAAVAVTPGSAPPRGLVLYLHGYGETAVSLTEGADQARIVDRLVADGYVVAASDAHFDAFGNAASQQAYVDLAAELTQRYGTDRTFLLAESMGALAGLQLMADERIPDIAGMAGINPLMNLGIAVGSYAEPLVRSAYGGRLPAGTEDPAQLPAEAFEGDAFRLYLAREDATVVTADNADPFVAKVRGIADVSVVQCMGRHVDPSCFQPDDLAAWFGDLGRG